MKTYLLKLDDAMYRDWQKTARSAGMKLAEWIRSRCNKEKVNDGKRTNNRATHTVGMGNPTRRQRRGRARRGNAVSRRAAGASVSHTGATAIHVSGVAGKPSRSAHSNRLPKARTLGKDSHRVEVKFVDGGTGRTTDPSPVAGGSTPLHRCDSPSCRICKFRRELKGKK